MSYVKTKSLVGRRFFLCEDKGGAKMARIIDGEAKNIVGDQVRAIRVSKRMSQQELADQLELLAIYVCRGSI